MTAPNTTIQFLMRFVAAGKSSARVKYSAGTRYVKGSDGKMTLEKVPAVTIYAQGDPLSMEAIFGSLYRNEDAIPGEYLDDGKMVILESSRHYEAALKRAQSNAKRAKLRFGTTQTRRDAKTRMRTG